MVGVEPRPRDPEGATRLRSSNETKHEPPGRSGRRDAASSVASICPHIGAPCVLASHSASAPRRRVIILLELLSPQDGVGWSRASRRTCSAQRSANAQIVAVGLTAPAVTNTLPSAMKRFGTSCARP